MRTTVDINDELLIAAKKRAAETRRTLSAVLEDALRLSLKEQVPAGTKLVIPSISMGSLKPGVDLDNSAALLDLMERED
ncbi:MAG: hypothetical protein RLZZ303_797 [Candidatus Hydrogenedentota bacterium]